MIILISIILIYVIDVAFGLIFPIKPWETEITIVSAPSYMDEAYYSREFLLERKASGNNDRYEWSPDSRLIFKTPFKGEYYNIERGSYGSGKAYRRTVNRYDYSSDATKVLMLGGSTMICVEVPDAFTISSQLSEILNDSGSGKYFIMNAGVESDTSFQELERLKLELESGLRPDIVIAYHGFNDINTGVYMNDPNAEEFENSKKGSIRRSLYKLLQGNIYDRLRMEADKKRTAIRMIPEHMNDLNIVADMTEVAVNNYCKNDRIMHSLSKEYGFKYYSILQPIGVYPEYAKDDLDLQLVSAWSDKYEPKARVAFDIGYDKLTGELERLKNDGILAYDWTGLFLDKKENMFIDTCHVNSKGNRKIAEAMAGMILEDVTNIPVPNGAETASEASFSNLAAIPKFSITKEDLTDEFIGCEIISPDLGQLALTQENFRINDIQQATIGNLTNVTGELVLTADDKRTPFNGLYSVTYTYENGSWVIKNKLKNVFFKFN